MEEGQRFVDVTDPDSGSTFRFYEVEYAVACAMDGQKDVAGLVAWSQSELGLQPSDDEIETVVSTLDELGYLSPEAIGGGDEFELGTAGKSELSAPRKAVTAEEVELGHVAPRADSEAETSLPAAAVASDSAGGGDVSVDLADHISVDTSDVKAAVRQSKVMDAMQEELDTEESAPAIEMEVGGETDTGAKPIEIPATPPKQKLAKPAPKPVSEPLHDVADATPPLPTPQPSGGGAGMIAILIIVLIGALVGGGWYVYSNFVKTDDGAQGEVKPAPKAKPAVAVKKKSPPPSARLEETAGSKEPLLAPAKGVVAWVADADEVDEGAVVIKLKGADKWEKKLKESAARMGVYEDKLSKAQEKGDKAAQAAAEAKVNEKAQELEGHKTELKKLSVMAPRSGVLELKVGLRDKVGEGDELGGVSGEFETKAEFTTDPSKYKAGATVTLVDSADASKKASCTVAELGEGSVVVTCVGGLPGGSTVQLN
jgi:hypothetical protein